MMAARWALGKAVLQAKGLGSYQPWATPWVYRTLILRKYHMEFDERYVWD